MEGDTVLPRGCRLCARGMGLTCVSVHGNLLEEELDERVDHLGGSCCHAPSTAAAVPERGVALDCMAATATATGLGRGSARVPVVSTTNEPHSRTRLCNDQITNSICIPNSSAVLCGRDRGKHRPLVAGSDARMNRFAPLDVTLETLSVQLYPDERILTHADGVGLYDGCSSLRSLFRGEGFG